jgi:Family of unknown function (DUF6492)
MSLTTIPFDVVISVGPNDQDIIAESFQYTKRNIIGYRRIFIVSSDPNLVIDGATVIDERVFPFSNADITNYLNTTNRAGWYLQQLLKLYAGRVLPDILENYLVLDSDAFFLKPTEFSIDNKYIFTTSEQNHTPYFEHMSRLDPSLKKVYHLSGISHHCFFNNQILSELFSLVEANHGSGETAFWRLFLLMVDKSHAEHSGASEYEIYFNFMCIRHPDKMLIRQLKTANLGHYDLVNNPCNFDFVGLHWYLR